MSSQKSNLWCQAKFSSLACQIQPHNDCYGFQACTIHPSFFFKRKLHMHYLINLCLKTTSHWDVKYASRRIELIFISNFSSIWDLQWPRLFLHMEFAYLTFRNWLHKVLDSTNANPSPLLLNRTQLMDTWGHAQEHATHCKATLSLQHKPQRYLHYHMA